jgi:hypothetical protein
VALLVRRAAGRGRLARRALSRRRALPIPAGAALRQLADHPYFEAKREIWRGPAMIAAIVGPDGVFRGGHVTWIDPESFGKAEIVDPETGEVLPAKKVRGSKSGNHIALSKRPSRRGS